MQTTSHNARWVAYGSRVGASLEFKGVPKMDRPVVFTSTPRPFVFRVEGYRPLGSRPLIIVHDFGVMGSCLSVPVSAPGGRVAEPTPTRSSKGGTTSRTPVAKGINVGVLVGPAVVRDDAGKPSRSRAQLKRLAVAAQAIHSLTDVSMIRHPRSQASAQMILDMMSYPGGNSSILFEGLSMVTKQAIMETTAPVCVQAGEVVIREGEDGSDFYIVDSGSFLVRKQGVEVGRCQRGFGFGEIGAMYKAPRTATVQAVTTGKLWRMERHVYQALKVAFTRHVDARKRVALDAVPLLEGLPEDSKGQMADVMMFEEYDEGQLVFRQHDEGDKFYIVDEGTVDVIMDGKVVAQLGEGAYFGERALIHGDRRNADIAATSFTSVFAIAREPFQQFFSSLNHAWTYSVLKSTDVFSSLSEPQLLQLAGAMRQVSVPAGGVVFRAGEPGDSFYIVEKGSCVIVNSSGQIITTCGAGKCFGEMALLSDRPRGASAVATSDSDAPLILLRGDVATFKAYLGNLQDIKNIWKIERLQKVQLLADLSRRDLSAICSCFVERTYGPGEVIFREGDEGSEFFIIEGGHCSVIKASSPLKGNHMEVAQLGPGHCFGERALLRRDPRTATVKAVTHLKVMVLSHGDFFAHLTTPVMESLIMKVGKLDAEALATQRHQLPAKLNKADLKLVRVLGKGAFGKVYLVRCKKNNIKYALKCIRKEKVITSRLTEHVIREKEVMEHLQSPFLVSLAASFQDTSHLYMMMQLVEGGELFNYLAERDSPLTEAEARFYGGCVILGLQELQNAGIAWRDLKPENILLDVAGYAILTDFGFAKVIERGKRSFTLCGTPEYLAPETVLQTGHTHAVDYWALGILIFEMVAGKPPFSDDDRMALFRSITSVAYEMPSYFSDDLKDLISKLLVKTPGKRLGVASISCLKSHPWFAGLDWYALAARDLRAPYIPPTDAREDDENMKGCTSFFYKGSGPRLQMAASDRAFDGF